MPSNPIRTRPITVPVIVLLAASFCTVPPCPAEEGFAEVFNGKDLDGWVVEGKAAYKDGDQEKPVWTVQDNTIVCAGNGFGFLRYDKQFSDAVIRVEYRMSKKCNSGLGIRSVKFAGRAKTRPSYAAYEIQILDDAGKSPGKNSSGSLYRYVAPSTNASKSAGEWNAIEIELRGPKIRVTLNDQAIHDFDQTSLAETKDKPLSGYFMLQNHGRRIEFRNVRVKELK